RSCPADRTRRRCRPGRRPCLFQTVPALRAARRTHAWPPARRKKAQRFQTQARGSRTGDACAIDTRKRAREDLPPGTARGYRSTLNMGRFLLAMALVALPAAARDPLRTWTDKDGVLHVEDAPSSGRVRAAPRKPAAQVNIPPHKPGERWWEKRTDAPPDEIDKAAARYNIPAELVRAVIWAESAGDGGAIS